MTWQGDELVKTLQGRLSHNVEAALRHLQRSVRNKLLVPYPPASEPGEPPHKRTGELQASVTYTMASGGLSGQLVATAEHAVYLEFGTQHMAPRPFLRNTLEEEAGVVKLLLGE